LSGKSYCLTVIACGSSNDASVLFLRAQMQKLIENSSRFEGTCNLQVFQLQEQGTPAKSSQKLRLHKRSALDKRRYGFSGVLYVFKGNHGITIKVQTCYREKTA